jgi:AcrR family transcriptional regulator
VDTTGPPAQPRIRDDDAAPPRRRADAERNIAAILDAALVCFGERPTATMADIARAAGVGRVTLYAHFPSREQLVAAALDRAVAEVGAALEDSTLDDAPADQALSTLIRSSWQVLDRHRMLFEAAQGSLDHERLRQHHDPAMARFDKLIARGQAEGHFRSDLPRGWLVTIIYSLLHAAAEEVNSGRMRPIDAADTLQATILPALAPTPLDR